MTPKEFDEKLAELRSIEQRMKLCTVKTPIARVVADQHRAQLLYTHLVAGIAELKAIDTNTSGNTTSDAR
jgi:hypothetical protein